MTARLLLGTTNRGKIEEMRSLLSAIHRLEVLTSAERAFPDVEETGTTFIENARIKARSAASATGLAVLAEDAGLEVLSLGGDPGVRSARYSGEPVDYARNNALLLENLRGATDRRARFVAVAALALPDGRLFTTEGTLEGRIETAARGTGGFGYDPLFVPEGETRTLAEMALLEKNRISHRRRAVEKMIPHIRQLLAERAFDS